VKSDKKNRNIIAIMCASILVLSLIITNTYAKRDNKDNTNKSSGDKKSVNKSFIDAKYVVDDDVKIRKEPDLKYDSILNLKKGDKVDVLYTVGDWSKIDYLDTTGYIESNLLTYINPNQNSDFDKDKSYRIRVNYDNMIDKAILTDKPDTNSKVVYSLPEGSAVELLWNDSNYSEIRYNDKVGYVQTRYIQEQDVQEKMENVVSIANRSINKPYNYKIGDAKLSNKGFITYVYKEALNENISGSINEIIKSGKIIDKNRVKPGDIVLFDTNKDNNPDKLGIYIGNNEFIHASRKDEKVQKDNLLTELYNDEYHSVIRVIY
jgi:SH3-like domain-containing protein